MMGDNVKHLKKDHDEVRVTELVIMLLQEIIKVREWIPHIGPLTKVIRLKLFLDIVPSS